jgi:hypothetical protein
VTTQSVLADALDALADEPVRVGGKCRVGEILAVLAPDDRAKLITYLGNTGIESTRLARTLTDNGHRVAAASVQRHRRRGTGAGCTCP